MSRGIRKLADVGTQELGTHKELTFKANNQTGRFGWLRLTPAYSFKLVREILSNFPSESVVLEPFSGSGTTPLVASYRGMKVYAREINPFLVWLGQVKTSFYRKEVLENTADTLNVIRLEARNGFDIDELWEPPISQIHKWWSEERLAALKVLRHLIDRAKGKTRDLLDVAFCRALINCSNVAFNHPSMSFSHATGPKSSFEAGYNEVVDDFIEAAKLVISTASENPSGNCQVEVGDSQLPFPADIQADILVTSPPYANRMSYIRELRPYMYWLRYLNNSKDAADLDWATIGGTWGAATSKIKRWQVKTAIPIETQLDETCEVILSGKSGDILSPYVRKYFHDIWCHLNAVVPAIKPGGHVYYIVGNSVFSGTMVPTHEWYAQMMAAVGLKDISVDVIRKRNCNKRLFEYAVHATK